MTKSKCKKCRKWHPQRKDILSKAIYSESDCCKCNEKIINTVLENEVKVLKINKGIVVLSKEDVEMVTFLLED